VTDAPAADGPNAEQRRYWNEQAGPRWVASQTLLDRQLEALGRLAMDRARVAGGEAVLDVGCGCGASALELARRVGPRGRVPGVDLSAPMLEVARRRAADERLAHLAFEQADAQTHPLPEARFQLVYSRFGVMFFADPVAAFANLRAALAPGGRIAFVCWQSLGQNPWMAVPLGAIAEHVALPPPPAPDAPGPFAFADRARVERILADAGFAGVGHEEVSETLTIGGTGSLDEAVAFLLQLGPAGALLRDAEPATRERAAAAVREAIAPHHGPEGVRMPSAAWVVTARRD